jgi:LysM repeat protein
MSHRRRRISRVLLAVLALTIAVGVFTYARRTPTKANELASADQPQASTPTSPATALAEQHPQTPPQSQPALATALPSVVGDAVIEPLRQPAPQTPPAPLRTETPSALVTQAPGATGNTVVSAQPQQQPFTPKQTAAPVNTAAKATAPGGSTGTDPAKVSIKPYQPPSGGHTSATGAEALADGRAKMQAGKLLEARDTVNSALASGKLSGYDADAARALLSEINQTVVFSNRKFADDRFGGTYQVQSGDRLDKIGARNAITSDMLMRINGLSDPRRLRSGAYIKVLKGPFHAVVSKSAFRLDLYLGGLPGSGADVAYVTSFRVGLGKDDSTPLGKWQVEPDRKVKNPVYYSPRGEGVIEADDPKNPLGEFWIGLAGLDGDAVGKESYGIHGTIEPDSIGKQSSMGCIRLRNEDVAVVFSALVEGKSTVLVVP